MLIGDRQLAVFAWTASNATRAMVRGVKIAYDQENERSVLERRFVTVGVTVAAIVITLVALAIIAAVPVWLGQLDPTHVIVNFGNFRWGLVGGGFALVAGLLWLAFVTLGASAQVGTPYCFGNACPCGNDDPD